MWGEIESPVCDPMQDEPDLSEVIHLAQQPDCLSNYDLPSRWIDTKEIILPCMESKMLYASHLHNYRRTMTDIIQDAELASEFNLVPPRIKTDIVLPEKPDVNKASDKKPIGFHINQPSDFMKGKGEDPPYLSEYTRKVIEQQCIATILTHLGFRNSYEDVMETFVDVFEVFLKNLCGQLRVANDSLLTGRVSSFPDIIEEVLTQSGLGGLKGLHDYYHNRIEKYETRLEKRCDALTLKYRELVTQQEKTNDPDELNIPEVHVTACDAEEGYLQYILNPGFQMLNSLEQDAQYATNN